MVDSDPAALFTRERSYHGVPYKLTVCALPGARAYSLDAIEVADFPPHKVGTGKPYLSMIEAFDAADRYARMIIDQQH